ncbi:MAG: ribosome assembly RNA-binding protein YhbY [Myxococcaceae bacterium]
MALDGKSRRKLRALGHHLEPVVIIGHSGVTESIVAAVEQALYDHELIKLKVNEGPADRHDAADELAKATGAEIAQVLGRTILLFKQRDENTKFDLKQKDAKAKEKAARTSSPKRRSTRSR